MVKSVQSVNISKNVEKRKLLKYYLLMLSRKDLEEFKEKYSKDFKVWCDEYHAHSYECCVGDEKSILICRLCDHILLIKQEIEKWSQ